MSRYVQRCRECRQVRGNTSFRVLASGGREPVCRWCMDLRDARARSVNDLQRQIAVKRKVRQELEAKLSAVRMEMAALRAEAASLVNTNITELAS